MASPAATIFQRATLDEEHEVQQIQRLTIGILISLGLWGIGLMQFYNVARKLAALKSMDGHLGKLESFCSFVLGVLFISDLLDTLANALFYNQHLRQSLLDGLGSPTTFPNIIVAVFVGVGWIGFLAHLLYASQIVKMEKKSSWILAALVVASSAAQLAGSAWTAQVSMGPIATWRTRGKYSTILWLGGAVWANALLFCILTIRTSKRRSHSTSAKNFVVHSLRFAFETNLLTSFLHIGALTLYLLFKDRNYYLSFALAMSKLSTLSITTFLNGVYRSKLAAWDLGANARLHQSSLSFGCKGRGGVGSRLYPSKLSGDGTASIKVTSEVHETAELPSATRPVVFDPEKTYPPTEKLFPQSHYLPPAEVIKAYEIGEKAGGLRSGPSSSTSHHSHE